MNIAANLEQAAFYFPDRCAIIDGDKNFSFKEFDQEANKIAGALVKKGLQPGDHVALCAPNSYAWLAIYFGTLKAGAVAVTFSHLLTKNELIQIIDDCRPKVLYTVDQKLDDIEPLRKRPYLELVICENGDISYPRLVKNGPPDFKIRSRKRQDPAAILYTGGTTGTPKGAVLSHENLQTSIHNIAHYERSTETDRALCFLPFNHVFGQVHIMLSTFYSGGGLIVQPGFDLQKALDAIKHLQITKFYAVPTIYIRLLELGNLRKKLGSVRYCFSAAASMAREVVREWKARAGLDIYESYGMTESSAMVTYNHYYRHLVGSVGTPVNLVEVQIRDFNGNKLEQGDEGEICICGPNITRGYLNNPEETRSAFWGEWFRSGDIGVMDEDGYLYVVDRLKDMIITGGENVYPREVEETLYTFPEVQECAVVGLPDKEYGERVTAFIVPRKGYDLEPKALRSKLKNQLAPFKVPKSYLRVEELPKSNTGKILKREIRKKYANTGK
ncbi:MAG: AMP-binding protein [Deltaproteobacteria bacterium]|nr:MAG: AMP-binding protein [Deltaproteobacteria bacterium]